MTAISGIKPATPPLATNNLNGVNSVNGIGTDADGDNDGSTKGVAPSTAPATPVVSKPTDTLGNNVNTFA